MSAANAATPNGVKARVDAIPTAMKRFMAFLLLVSHYLRRGSSIRSTVALASWNVECEYGLFNDVSY
jgi:hypothetical protein